MTKRHNENMQRTSLFITCLFVAGHTQGTCPQFSLSYPPNGTYLCPGSNITYTCVLNSSVISVITIWKGSAFECLASTGQISLLQKSDRTPIPTASGSCGSLSAVTTNISPDGTCYTSVLTIPAVQALNGTTVMCADGSTLAVVGNDTLKITTSPGPVGNITLNSPSVGQLTVAWAPPTTGGVPTSYNVSINDSSNTSFTIPANGTLQKTFTGLTRDTLYTVSVVAINCAGTSNVTSANRTCSEGPGPSVEQNGATGMASTGTILGGCVGGAVGLLVFIGLMIAAVCLMNKYKCWDKIRKQCTRTSPPDPLVVADVSVGPNQVTVASTPPTTGDVPTSYDVINDSSSTLVSIPANGPLQITFTGLTSDYAGTSYVTSQTNKTRNARAVAADGGDGDDGDELHNTSDSTSPTTATIRRRQLTNNPNTVQ